MKQKAVSLVWDLLVLAGLVVFVVGLWRAWQPLGMIVGGALIAGGGFFAGYRRNEKRSAN